MGRDKGSLAEQQNKENSNNSNTGKENIQNKQWNTQSNSCHWKRLPREAVDTSSLEVFKARLNGYFSYLAQWKVSLPMAGGLELDDL